MDSHSPSAGLSLDIQITNRKQTLELLEIIVKRLESAAQQRSSDDSGCVEQILLDAEICDTRYLLVRLPSSNRVLTLSPREQEIARMVGQGHSNKVIAAVLNISSWTVCTHVRRIFSKLGVSSRAAMIARLLEHESVAEHLRQVPQTPVASSKGCDALRKSACPNPPKTHTETGITRRSTMEKEVLVA